MPWCAIAKPCPRRRLTIPHKCLRAHRAKGSPPRTRSPRRKEAWINVVRPSRRPLRGLLRVRSVLNAINGLPHAEERSPGSALCEARGQAPSASRSTRRHRCSLSCSRCVLSRYQQLAGRIVQCKLMGKGQAAGGADKTLPARREQIIDAGRLIREAALELDQGAGKVGHSGLSTGNVRRLFYSSPDATAKTFRIPGRRGISLY